MFIGTWLFVAFFDAFLLATLGGSESKLEKQMLFTAGLITVTALGELMMELAAEGDRSAAAKRIRDASTPSS